MNRKRTMLAMTGALAVALVLGSLGVAYGATVTEEGEGGIAGAVKRAGGGLIGVVADLTGLDARDVAERRADGESLAAIAASEDVAVDDVKTAASDEFDEHLDERLNSTEAPPMRGEGRGMKGAKGNPSTDVVAELTGLEVDEIREMRVEGKSLAQIAEAEGVNTDDLVAAILADAEEKLQAAVDDGKMDADEADEKLENITERIEEMVNSTDMPQRGEGGPGRDAE